MNCPWCGRSYQFCKCDNSLEALKARVDWALANAKKKKAELEKALADLERAEEYERSLKRHD